MSLREIIGDIQDALRSIETAKRGSITDFKTQRIEGSKAMLSGAIKRLLEATKSDPIAQALAQKLAKAEPTDSMPILEKLAGLATNEQRTPALFDSYKLPSDIREAIAADLSEIQACMNAGCYRSSTILCGRVMETALHRKYFDATGQDLLEKAPGIGLGSLIAKLAEKGVKLDPGLPNQIHLINQVRVFSVHTKQDAFAPSKMQTEAIVLYTRDILEKLFK